MRSRLPVLLVSALIASGLGYLVAHETSDSAAAKVPVLLAGNGIGTVRFGAAESSAIAALDAIVGRQPGLGGKGVLARISDCSVDSKLSFGDVDAYFGAGRFVGYTTSYLNVIATDTQLDIHNALEATGGLRLTDTVGRAKALFGTAFKTYGARGGSWSAVTASGTFYGSLLNPPAMTGSSDLIVRIAAGDQGCY